MSTRISSALLRVGFCLVTLILAATPTRAESVSQTVAQARQTYAQIERNLKHLRRAETDLSGYSVEGGSLVAHFENGTVRKLQARYLGEAGRAVEEYYFAGGRLFFVLRTELRYDKPLSTTVEGGTGTGNVAKRMQNRSYFAQGKLVRWVDQDGKIRSTGKDFLNQEREILAQARRLLSTANALMD
jgi:hypothetical protein